MKLNKTMKKCFSVVLSLSMVATSVTVYDTTAKADAASRAATIELIQDSSKNLALGKMVTAVPSIGEGAAAGVKLLTDGVVENENIFVATAFNTKETAYIIDLGDTYDATSIDQIVSQHKKKSKVSTPVKGYKIQYSANGLDYYDVKSVPAQEDPDNPTWSLDGQDNLDVQEISDEIKIELAGKAVQYVKFYYPDAYQYGVGARELAVLDINEDAETVEIERCDEAAGVEASSDDFNTLTYKVIAGQNQEDYVYNVYLDGTQLIGDQVRRESLLQYRILRQEHIL